MCRTDRGFGGGQSGNRDPEAEMSDDPSRASGHGRMQLGVVRQTHPFVLSQVHVSLYF